MKVVFANKSLMLGNIIRTFISNYKIILPQVTGKGTWSAFSPVRKMHKECMSHEPVSKVIGSAIKEAFIFKLKVLQLNIWLLFRLL